MNWTLDHVKQLKQSGKISGFNIVNAKQATDIPDLPVKKKRRGQPEFLLQKSCFNIFWLKYTELHSNLYSVPNGGYRNKGEAKKLKATGTMKGVWDSFLSIPRKGKSGLYIEFKAGKNGLTDAQMEFKEKNEGNYAFAICYTTEEFLKAIDEYLN